MALHLREPHACVPSRTTAAHTAERMASSACRPQHSLTTASLTPRPTPPVAMVLLPPPAAPAPAHAAPWQPAPAANSVVPERRRQRCCRARAAPPPAAAPQSAPREDEQLVQEPFHEDGSDPNAEVAEALPLLHAANTRVRSAEYVSSAVAVAQCPAPQHPEFAVIGRSNVGKSSLINMLTNSKRLAHVSKEPGKTRCINHFLINGSWYLVDLPGYGFARTGLATRGQFDKFTRQYFQTRQSLALVYLLVDSSIAPQRIDLDYAVWLHRHKVPFALVFTKADKRKRGQPPCRENVAAFKQALLQDLQRIAHTSGGGPSRRAALPGGGSSSGGGAPRRDEAQEAEQQQQQQQQEEAPLSLPPCIVTSSETGLGRTALLHLTSALRDSFAATGRLEEAMVEWRRAQVWGGGGGDGGGAAEEEEEGGGSAEGPAQGRGAAAGAPGGKAVGRGGGGRKGGASSLVKSTRLKKRAAAVLPGDGIPLPQWTVRASERGRQQQQAQELAGSGGDPAAPAAPLPGRGDRSRDPA